MNPPRYKFTDTDKILKAQRRKIRRLEHALREITASPCRCYSDYEGHHECPKCIATRALKGKG